MSSPASCSSPATQSSYCPSVFSYGAESPSNRTNISSPDSTTPKESYSRSPLLFASPPPCLKPEPQASISSNSSNEVTETLSTIISPTLSDYMDYEFTASCDDSSCGCYPAVSSSYPEIAHYAPQHTSTKYQAVSEFQSLPITDMMYRSQHYYPISGQSPATSSPRGLSLDNPCPLPDSISEQRRLFPPIDTTVFQEEVWYTRSGKKVPSSAMYMYCATM